MTFDTPSACRHQQTSRRDLPNARVPPLLWRRPSSPEYRCQRKKRSRSTASYRTCCPILRFASSCRTVTTYSPPLRARCVASASACSPATGSRSPCPRMTSLAGASPSGTSEPVAAEIGTSRDGERRRCTTLWRLRPAPPVRHRPPGPDDGILRLRIPGVRQDAIPAARDRHHIAAKLRGDPITRLMSPLRSGEWERRSRIVSPLPKGRGDQRGEDHPSRNPFGVPRVTSPCPCPCVLSVSPLWHSVLPLRLPEHRLLATRAWSACGR